MNHSAERVLILVNPQAGRGRGLRVVAEAISFLQAAAIPFQVFDNNWPVELEQGSDIWLAGGDGTLNYFINHYPKVLNRIVFLKAGTGNDFHQALHGKISLIKQFETALHGSCRVVDIAACNDRLFINGIGIGFEGEIARLTEKNKSWPGKTSFLLAILRNMFHYRSRHYRVMLPDETWEMDALMISVMNGQTAGGGFRIAPEAEAGDGLLDLVCIGKLNTWQRLRYLPVIERGRHLHLPFVRFKQTSELKIYCSEEITAHADGEYFTSSEFHIRVLPHKLCMRTEIKNPG